MILINSRVREKCRRSCSQLAFLYTFSLPLPCCLTQVHLQELFYQGLESKLTSHLWNEKLMVHLKFRGFTSRSQDYIFIEFGKRQKMLCITASKWNKKVKQEQVFQQFIVQLLSSQIFLFLETYFFTSFGCIASAKTKKTLKYHNFKLTVTTYTINEHHQCL